MSSVVSVSDFRRSRGLNPRDLEGAPQAAP